MSRHHPYSGYDESPHSSAGHRKNGLGNRGANGRAHSHGGRPGRRSGGGGGGGASGGAGGGGVAGGNHHHGFGGSHSDSAGSNKSGWDAQFERELAHVPRGPAKSFKNRGSLRGPVAAKLRANGFQKLEQDDVTMAHASRAPFPAQPKRGMLSFMRLRRTMYRKISVRRPFK